MHFRLITTIVVCIALMSSCAFLLSARGLGPAEDAAQREQREQQINDFHSNQAGLDDMASVDFSQSIARPVPPQQLEQLSIEQLYHLPSEGDEDDVDGLRSSPQSPLPRRASLSSLDESHLHVIPENNAVINRGPGIRGGDGARMRDAAQGIEQEVNENDVHQRRPNRRQQLIDRLKNPLTAVIIPSALLAWGLLSLAGT